MSAGRRLVRALEASAATSGCAVRVTVARERPWSSATFVGSRHTVVVECGPKAADWLAGLAETVLGMHGHLVVELVVRRTPPGAEIDALTVEA